MGKNITAYSPMSKREKEFLQKLLQELEPKDIEFIMKYIQAVIDVHSLTEANILLEKNIN